MRFATVLLFAATFAACGGSDPSDPSDPSEKSDTSDGAGAEESDPSDRSDQSDTSDSALSDTSDSPYAPASDPAERDYPWLKGREAGEPIWKRFDPPEGFVRVPSEKGTFANWLRHLPLKPGRPDVMLHDGTPKGRQDVHAAVVDIDVGRRDLQQCVDACMRLRAEYLWSAGRPGDICFTSVGGQDLSWKKWRAGFRPKGRRWEKAADPAGGWGAFRGYMNRVFGTCNTRSQLEQMIPVGDPGSMEIGHVFLNRPNPDYFGHAVMIVDMAARRDGKKAFMLVQSYMPAQEIHVLSNHEDEGMSPWFTLEEGRPLVTPEWTFEASDLMGYPEKGCSE